MIGRDMDYHGWRGAMGALLLAALVAAALVLAFFVGRLTAPMLAQFHSQPGAEQKAQDAFEAGAQDGIWTDADHFALTSSLVGLDQEAQLRVLGHFAGEVNAGKLKLDELVKRKPPVASCCKVCERAGYERGAGEPAPQAKP